MPQNKQENDTTTAIRPLSNEPESSIRSPSSPNVEARDQAPPDLVKMARFRSKVLQDAYFPKPSTNPHHEVGTTETHGLAQIIASYNDGNPESVRFARQNTLAETIRVLAAQVPFLPKAVQENVHFVLANNGMSEEQKIAVAGCILGVNSDLKSRGIPPIKFHIADAPKDINNPLTSTAAYARNKAFEYMKEIGQQSPGYRGIPVHIGDDDAVTIGIAEMHRIITEGQGDIGAVAPKNHSTSDVLQDGERIRADIANSSYAVKSDNIAFKPFLGVFDPDGKLNFCLLTAFGGSRIPKTCSLMLSGGAAEELSHSNRAVFLVCPEGSFEDMFLSSNLTRRGYELVGTSDAHVYDQVRLDPNQRGLQQFRWAFDHAMAFADHVALSKRQSVDLVHNGALVLQPQDGQWMQSLIPARDVPTGDLYDSKGVHAAIVNPVEVRELLMRIKIDLARDQSAFVEKYPYVFSGRIGSFKSIDSLQATVDLSLRLLDYVQPQIPRVQRQIVGVEVLSKEQVHGPDRLRFDDDIRVARLLGNLAAIASLPENDIDQGIVRVALLGPRQPTR